MMLDVLRGRKEDKRGQVTVFIILGVLILAIVLGFMFLGGETVIKKFGEEKDVPTEVAGVKLFVEGCLKKAVNEGIILIGENGGYYHFDKEIPNFHLKPYYFYEGEVLVPPLGRIEKELEEYIEVNLQGCTEWFGLFEGFDVEDNPVKAKVKISEERVDVGVKYLLKIVKGDSVMEMEDFEYSVEVRLGKSYHFLKSYYEGQNESAGIKISELTEFAEEEGFYYYLVEKYNPNVFLILIDKTVEVKGVPFMFVVANKYKWDEVEI